MSQLELPTTIIYGDGTWEIVNLNPDKIRGDILKNYPLGNPMHGFTLAIQNDYLARKQNLEPGLQSELYIIDSGYPPLQNPTPDEWLSRATHTVNELLFQKSTELQNKLRDVQTTELYDKLQATYAAMLINDQIKSLQERQTRLYAETARRQAEAIAQREATQRAEAAEAQRQAAEQVRLAALAEAKRIADEKSRIAAEAEAERIDEYKRNLSFVADMNKYILEKYGAHAHQIAKDLQSDISGKKVRSYSEAMKTFEKVRMNPNARLSAQDTQAVVNALNALDKATFADNVNRLAKAFGVTGKAVQAHSVVEKAAIGFQDGNWKPLMLELESIAAGAGAGMLLAVMMTVTFPAFSASALGVVSIALLMASAAAYLNAKEVEAINNGILHMINNPPATN